MGIIVSVAPYFKRNIIACKISRPMFIIYIMKDCYNPEDADYVLLLNSAVDSNIIVSRATQLLRAIFHSFHRDLSLQGSHIILVAPALLNQ